MKIVQRAARVSVELTIRKRMSSKIISSGVKTFKCKECGKSFHYKSQLKRRERVHTEEKPFLCNQCGKSFDQATNLKKQYRIHTGEKPFGCNQCGKRYKHAVHKSNMKEHTQERSLLNVPSLASVLIEQKL